MTIQNALDAALAHHRAGELPQAEHIYRQVLAVDPKNSDALHLLGVIANEVGRADAAVELIGRALALQPDVAGFHRNLAMALQSLGRIAEAADHFRKAAELRPEWADAHASLGALLAVLGRLDESVAALRHAVKLEPSGGALGNLGSVLGMAGQLDESVEALKRVVALEPQNAQARYNLGNSLRELGLVEPAIEQYREAVRLKPDYSLAYSALLLALQYRQDEPSAVLREHRAWEERLARPLMKETPRHANDRSRNRRLRVGYVSGDFREHAARYFLEPLLRAHDPAQVEIFCYSSVSHEDEVTARMKGYARAWHDTRGWPDERLVETVRTDAIDVLVDLALHSGGSRLLAMASKPAPVQVSYLGYCSTTGLSAIDWRLTDDVIDPPDGEQFSVERPYRLDGGFCCYQPPEPAPEVAAPSVERSGFVTFGNFNNLAKISDPMLSLWAEILRQVPNSRLLVQTKGADQKSARDRMRSLFESRGVDPQRIEFRGSESMGDYLRTLSGVDVCLDTYPFNGHTTTCHALWMGAPVVTRYGRVPLSRVGLSLLTSLGLADLSAADDQRYARAAVELSRDRTRMNDIRKTLRDRMRGSPLMDEQRLARAVESAYRQMWRQWCGVEP